MSISNYTLKIKELCDSLGSINVNIDDDEMVQICLGGLAPRFNTIRSVVLRCCWLKKTTSEQEATHLTVRCSIQNQTKEEDKAMEEGVKQAKVGTIKGNLGNKISTPDKMSGTREAER